MRKSNEPQFRSSIKIQLPRISGAGEKEEIFHLHGNCFFLTLAPVFIFGYNKWKRRKTLVLDIDTAKLPDGPALFFEIAEE